MLDVAVIIDNLVQFYSIKEGVDELLRKKIKVDIYVPDDPKQVDLAEYTLKKLVTEGYTAISRVGKKHKYKVLLEPYPKIEHKDSLKGIEYVYRLKYKYSLLSAKPDPVYSPAWNMPYDAILTYSTYEYELLRAYTETRIIRPIKYMDDSKLLDKGNKKRLLYLPTFDNVDEYSYPKIESVFKKLKGDYELIIKSHHATQFRDSEKRHADFLQQIADIMYDQSTPLSSIIKAADIVLTGNSGSIYEALYFNKPISVFSPRDDKFKLGSINPFHYNLMNSGTIPSTDNPVRIPDIIKESLGKKSVQKAVRVQQFESNNVKYEDFTDVIVDFLARDDKKDEKHQLRREMMYYVSRIKADNVRLRLDSSRINIKLEELAAECLGLRDGMRGYEQSVSWRVTRPLRALNAKIRKVTNR